MTRTHSVLVAVLGLGNLHESVYYLIVPHQGDKVDKFCIFCCRPVVGSIHIHIGRIAMIRSISCPGEIVGRER